MLVDILNIQIFTFILSRSCRLRSWPMRMPPQPGTSVQSSSTKEWLSATSSSRRRRLGSLIRQPSSNVSKRCGCRRLSMHDSLPYIKQQYFYACYMTCYSSHIYDLRSYMCRALSSQICRQSYNVAIWVLQGILQAFNIIYAYYSQTFSLSLSLSFSLPLISSPLLSPRTPCFLSSTVKSVPC